MSDVHAAAPAKRDGPRFQTVRVIFALMVREMITRYGRSWGGYIWAIAEPVGMIAMLSLAFSQFLRTPALGSSFILFYAAGYLPFAFYLTLNSITSTAVASNRSLLHFPMVTPMDSVLARAALQMLTMVIVTIVVLTGIALILGDPVQFSMEGLIAACLAASILGIGGGTLNTVLYCFFPSYKNLWAIISRPLFIVSGIFYTVESMPKHVQAILVWNPLVHVTGQSHKAFYPIYDGSFVKLWYPIGVGVVMFLIGGALLMRHKSFIIENS